jgi:hypothetical protein
MAVPPPPLGLDAALAAALAPTAATLANIQAQQALQAGVLANIQAQLALINPAGIAAGIAAAASLSLQAIEAARGRNRHDQRGVPYIPVPRPDGTPPPSWPAGGFDRAALVEGPIPAVDALLADYGLPAGPVAGAVPARRVALAQALGTRLV